MNNTDDNLARQKFQDRITKGMLGPGSDTWGVDDNEEIISDYPLIRYFTGVLFPDKTNPDSQLESDTAEVENESDENEELEESKIVKEVIDIAEENNVSTKKENEEELKLSQNSFFPTNIGLTICLADFVKEVEVDFSFGLYYQPTYKEKRIKINEAGFDSFFDEKIPYQFPFKDKLKFDGEFMFLEKDLEGHSGGRDKTRSGDFQSYDKFKNSKNLIDTSAKYYIGYIEKLISRAWKRKHIIQKCTIEVEPTSEPIPIKLPEKLHKELKVGYNVKTYVHQGRKFVKIQLVNISTPHPKNKFSNKNEKLNSKCLFQANISVSSNNILPYKTQYERFPFDKEAERLNFIYRNIKSFGIGHNCAVEWEGEKPTSIKTSFLPHADIKDVKNDFDDANDEKLNDALNIKNLSTFGLPKNKVLENLKYFISLYEQWIKNQQLQTENLDFNDAEISSNIISKQTKNLSRLKESIILLEDDNIFKAFQMANTAMYIQMITSNDKDFGKDEKELSELTHNVDYNSYDFFRKYNAEQKKIEGKLKFIPKYRPFQLAFMLISIDGVTINQDKSRKEIVDLIWFPTGGGKTEAYLAVTALTIIWRRLNNEIGYEGTTVIMRYTLRLLTAQQFERASRLISALEFLRQQPEFNDVLRSEPITIGLWVGMASTPNKLDVAKKKIDEIEKECDRKNGNPKEKNIFQISACPWCGTKLISKKDGNWDYGFDYTRNDLKINCLNKKCAFHNRIPVQVVDELLYEKPPTLLFGTVDKFAMLAWQEKAFMFFNTHDDNKLPPDLIIQDELHLLSGPLGSITGIYESVIELLSTKNGHAPKIIASTATTRNTDSQIEKLYGNRKVNVFPPTGITQDDSFFAKEDESKSKRRYLGFMPTGKTAIDTQLQLLAHLLVARLEVYLDSKTKGSANNYWSLVSYYNSLRDVGRTNNKVGDEITTYTGFLQNRLSTIFPGHIDEYKYNFLGIYSRTKELTSRIQSERIKETLSEIEKEFSEKSFSTDENGRKYLNDVVDIILATNMISVGIDISRLNIMLLNGMPKNIAEYIQASSRIGRSTKGLAITLFDPNRAREKSYFEHFKTFHQTFYKAVEPLSVTPFTENTIKKMLSSMLVAFIRQNYPGELNRKNQAGNFTKDKIQPLLEFVTKRFINQKDDCELFEREIIRLADEWEAKISQVNLQKYEEILLKPGEHDGDNEDWILMQSMREVDTNTYIQIKGNK
jgi:hypothetical protein